MITFVQKKFTRYDDTDNLKRMKDADILAEKKKEGPSYASSVLPSAVHGAVIGGTALGIGGALMRSLGKGAKGARGAAFMKGLRRGAIGGAIGGALLLGNSAARKHREESEDREFYNDRLEYAQRQAQRREKTDWKQNMTQRDGYSY